MMYTEFVIVILGISLILYTLLGGADFGAGIVELFTGDESNSTVSRAMAPVWEANHMWLIIAVVILFNGFPKAYTVLSTQLHIPVLLFLIAIILRGTAFTFRHYDAFHDYTEQFYSTIFRYSSLFAVFFLGVTISGFFGGTLSSNLEGNFLDAYIFPWLNWFSISVGIFMVILSAYIAAIFLLGEVKTEAEYTMLQKFSLRLFILAIVSGLSIFVSSALLGLQFHNVFFNNPTSIGIGIISMLFIPYIFYLIKRKQIWKLRFVVGLQIVLILSGWFAIQWPNFVLFNDGSVLSIYQSAAPTITMKILFTALAVGVVVIFPGLYYLFKIFKMKN